MYIHVTPFLFKELIFNKSFYKNFAYLYSIFVSCSVHIKYFLPFGVLMCSCISVQINSFSCSVHLHVLWTDPLLGEKRLFLLLCSSPCGWERAAPVLQRMNFWCAFQREGLIPELGVELWCVPGAAWRESGLEKFGMDFLLQIHFPNGYVAVCPVNSLYVQRSKEEKRGRADRKSHRNTYWLSHQKHLSQMPKTI